MRFVIRSLAALTPIVMFACQAAQPAYAPPLAAIHSNITLHHQMPQSGALGPRRGEACVYSYVGIYATGDAGVRAAAASGGVTTIRAVDYSYMSWFWFFFQRTCTIVYGE